MYAASKYVEERFQLDNMLRSEWVLRRLHRAEAHLWEYYTLQANRTDGVPLGEALAKNSTVFNERAYKEAKAELQRLQTARQPQQNRSETPKLASFLHVTDSGDAPHRTESVSDRSEASTTGPTPQETVTGDRD